MTGTPRMSVAQYREMHGLGPVEPAPRISSSPTNPRDFLPPAAAHRTAGHQGAAADQVKACRAGRGGVKAKQPQGGHIPDAGKLVGRGRFGNVRTDGPAPWGGQRRYDSKRESEKARELRDREQCGQNVGWFCQVSIPIGVDDKGREIRARVDFLELMPDGPPIIWDPKGHENGISRVKRAALRARGFDVRLW